MREAMAHCAEYGFDRTKRRGRLALFALTRADHETAARLHGEVIAPQFEPIVEAYYRLLGENAELRRATAACAPFLELQDRQIDCLLSLGVRFEREVYFEERLGFGRAHARLDVPLAAYQASQSVLQRLIVNSIPETVRRDGVGYAQLLSFVLRIMAFDLSLGIDTYHLTRVQDLERSLSVFRSRAETDSFTGLANHDHILEVIAADLQGMRRDGRRVSLIVADLDLFKSVNDGYGHVLGDKVLQAAAARMRAAVRETDVLGRYGGDEFVVVLNQGDLLMAQEVAERIRNNVGQPLEVNGLRLFTTVSLGIAMAEPGDDTESLVARADAALYQAKRAGRNCAVVYLSDRAAGRELTGLGRTVGHA